MTTSWLTTPPRAVWPDNTEDVANPFVRYRQLLWSWHRWTNAGNTDHDFVDLVNRINNSIAEVDGNGFVMTPSRWVASLGITPARSVFTKDETANVGGSHKARHLMGLLLHLAVDAVENERRLAIASCGNAALGAATVARAAGRPIDVFIPTWAKPQIVAELERLQANVHVCERRPNESGDPTMLRFQEAVKQGALPFGVQATENLWALDGGRSIGWELADQLGEHHLDHVLIQVGGGALLTSCAIGLIEASQLGTMNRVPKVWAVQAEGCAPFQRAWTRLPTEGSVDDRLAQAEQQSAELMFAWENPSSVATGILDDITYDWLGVARALLVSGGSSVVTSEDEISAANERVRAANFNVSHTGSAGYAGYLAGVRKELISPNDATAVLITGVHRPSSPR